MEAISDLPMLHDMDADYSSQYAKLARNLRDKIKSGDLKRLDALPARGLATEYGVSARVAYAALEMPAANRYVGRPQLDSVGNLGIWLTAVTPGASLAGT